MIVPTELIAEKVVWSKRRWIWMVTLVFLFHLLFLLAFSNLEPVTVTANVREPDIRMLAQPLPPALSEIWTLEDPTLFAFARPHGFAQEAWKEPHRIEYQSPDWVEPPLWLELRPSYFGSDSVHYLAENPPVPPEIPPRPPAGFNLPIAPPLLGAVQSQLRVDGDLARWKMRAPQPLPVIPSADPLTNSVVRAMVSQAGLPISVLLLSTSGSKEADQIALEYARRLRFDAERSQSARLAAAAPAYGTLVFQWATAPAAAQR